MEVEGNVVDGSDGKVACDSYNNYREDVRLIADMGMTHYRFSIAWSRILPEGGGDDLRESLKWSKSFGSYLQASVK